MHETGTATRREMMLLTASAAVLATSGRAGAMPAAAHGGPGGIAEVLPAMPGELPLNWADRADAFDRFIMNPANKLFRSRADGSRYFASALEGTGDGGLTTFAPIVLGKILRGEPMDWLTPSLAAYYGDAHGIFLDGHEADSCEYWYLMNVNALAAGIIRSHLAHDPAWTGRLRTSADRLIALAHQIDYDFNDQGYRFDTRRAWTKQDIYRQPDAVGGYAYLCLLAYESFGNANYLSEAREGLRRYLSFPRNPWYEVPSGAMACLAAARLSVLDPGVDVAKALRFVLDPGGRPLQTGTWGRSRVDGLMAGFRTEPPGEAYSMESLMTAGYLLPVVRYRPEFASAIGRYLLSAAANLRLFYSDCIPAENQSRPELTSAVPYERLSRTLGGKSPFAAGDYGSHRSIYGGAYALWWGELVRPTEEPFILKLDLARTDFFEPKKYPTFLYYNPHADARSLTVPTPDGVRLYDLAAHRFLESHGASAAQLAIPPMRSRIIVQVPDGTCRTVRRGRLVCNDVTVDYALPNE